MEKVRVVAGAVDRLEGGPQARDGQHGLEVPVGEQVGGRITDGPRMVHAATGQRRFLPNHRAGYSPLLHIQNALIQART
jgi:hypothetical protein